MNSEQFNELIRVLDVWFGRIVDQQFETKQLIKACFVANIELPKGISAELALKQIEVNEEGI